MLDNTKSLRKQLRRFADLLADEAERNPEFADSLLTLLTVDGVREKRKRSEKRTAPDPFEIFRTKGADKFRQWLNDLSVQDLRGIVRQHRFDPTRLSDKWKTKERFIQLICERVESRSKQGDVFRFYGKDITEAENKTVGAENSDVTSSKQAENSDADSNKQ